MCTRTDSKVALASGRPQDPPVASVTGRTVRLDDTHSVLVLGRVGAPGQSSHTPELLPESCLLWLAPEGDDVDAVRKAPRVGALRRKARLKCGVQRGQLVA